MAENKLVSLGLFHPKWSYFTLLTTGDGAHLVQMVGFFSSQKKKALLTLALGQQIVIWEYLSKLRTLEPIFCWSLAKNKKHMFHTDSFKKKNTRWNKQLNFEKTKKNLCKKNSYII